ncbi:MAG: ABC transporter ATP-binding protein [Herpetosiphonaceae bacterium]|nr:ABC transporter ATP-binding protein [Herpetosiphonaceae bacterium]
MTASSRPTLICQGISKLYPTRSGGIAALTNVSFTVRPEEFVCIVGPSGCGKSTLLKLLAGLIAPTTGQLIFSEPAVPDQPRNALVFQEHGLFPWLTVLDNVAFGLETRGVRRQERQERARAFLAQVGLSAFADNYPHELSVGMRQRVGIARAFLSNPQLLLMDEPFSALDAQSKLVLQEELLRIWKDHRTMVVYVTHDIEEAVLLGDRVLVMSGHPGRIQEEIQIPLGRPRDLRDREQQDVRKIAWHIWKAIEAEVREDLRVAS